MEFSFYDNPERIANGLKAGKHRRLIGGMWDQIGPLQLDLLKDQGLKPGHRLLDIGCGALRLGTLAVPYLRPRHYFGTDLNRNLMLEGHRHEIAEPGRLPLDNLVQDADFTFPGIPGTIDYAIAVSVFTHLPFNHLRRCLLNLRRFKKLDRFCFTVFLAPSVEASTGPVEQLGGITSFDTKDPFHFVAEDLDYLGRQTGYDISFVDWDHPRNQKMCVARPLA